MGMREKKHVRESKSSSTKTSSQEIRQMNPKWHYIYYLEIPAEAAEVVTPGEQDKDWEDGQGDFCVCYKPFRTT